MMSFFYRFRSQSDQPQGSLGICCRSQGYRPFPYPGLIVRVSSVLSNTDLPSRSVKEQGSCGVKAQLATVEERLVLKIIGAITAVDRQALDERLRAWLQI
jgi:hypothetical protein